MTEGPKKPQATHNTLKPKSQRLRRWSYRLATLLGVGVTAAVEVKTSFLQSFIFQRVAEGKIFTHKTTMSARPAPPATGPYDQRLGYARIGEMRQRLAERGFTVTREKQWDDRNILGMQLFPIYNEKAQAGLRLLDDTQQPFYATRFPKHVYDKFEDIPPVLVNSLLFVENRALMQRHAPTWNPAIEWERLVNAILGYGLKSTGLSSDHSGGSTLATQTEKFRHSPGGVTAGPTDKLQQMMTASARSYEDGIGTTNARRHIVLNYLNSMPLSSYPGFGEVNGFGDGISTWFGTDFAEATRLLNKPQNQMNDDEMREAARVYRQALSLVMAVKKPTSYLVSDRAGLQDRVERFLPLLVEAGIITPKFKDMVMAAPPVYATPVKGGGVPQSKQVKSIQIDLMKELGVKSLYDLDRMDVTATTTVDADASAAVARIFTALNTPEGADSAGITGFRLLQPQNVGNVIYSFTLYEKKPGANVLRVQTDNYNGQLNLNEGSKLELGSTAKLRTMVSYLEAVADLHGRYASMDTTQFAAVSVNAADNLTRWAFEYLSTPGNDTSLNGMLEASLDRKYSGSTDERFYTGGGIHTFSNFEREDNGKILTVRDAFHRSVNLPFVRMMRDIVGYTYTHKMNIDPAIFTDAANPQHIAYLNKFADAEGQTFMWKFWKEQKNVKPEDAASQLAAKTRRQPAQLAVIYRSLYPAAPYADMEAFIRKECPTCAPTRTFEKEYEDYAPGKFDLNDRGYITKLHPLEIWLAEYRMKAPQSTWVQAVEASQSTRLESYKWLMKSHNLAGQNARIKTILEREAFEFIQKTWQEKGFPFDKMVPSYASALGASGDTPAALADLAGIIQNGGLERSSIKFKDIEFGTHTPYETHFTAAPAEGRRVMAAEIASLVRKEMQQVVEHGTAQRANGAVTLSDGRVLSLGGKTGTGDNRLDTHTKGGALISSNVTSRTAAFVFAIDDRFYGSLIAYVPGADAADFKFTSALPVQIFKALVPAIRPVLDRAYEVKVANKANPPKPPL